MDGRNPAQGFIRWYRISSIHSIVGHFEDTHVMLALKRNHKDNRPVLFIAS